MAHTVHTSSMPYSSNAYSCRVPVACKEERKGLMSIVVTQGAAESNDRTQIVFIKLSVPVRIAIECIGVMNGWTQ